MMYEPHEGRPFIIAGHSQGSAILRFVLKDYFKTHPDRYERMVAAYVIGYSITKDDLEANPHMKFAMAKPTQESSSVGMPRVPKMWRRTPRAQCCCQTASASTR